MSVVYLASSSPFRRAQLDGLHLSFEVISPDIDEAPQANETARQLVERLSIAKASTVAAQLNTGLVIGSDQVAVIDGEVVGKPGDHARALQQLRRCSDREVVYLTGVALINVATAKQQLAVVRTEVGFRALDDVLIESYLRLDQPYQCAGSIRSESLGISLMRYQRSDDPSALIGLPLIYLLEMLRSEGVDPALGVNS